MRNSRTLVLGAFAVIYLVWGSTYLAIFYAAQAIPPLLMAGTRFLAAGILMAVVLKLRGVAMAPRDEWPRAFLLGGTMLLAGNGFLSMAEQHIPTGLGALLIASVPLWIVGLQGKQPAPAVAISLLMGLVGVAILVPTGSSDADGRTKLVYSLLVLLGSALWAVGSLYGRRKPSKANLLASVAQQMVAGGVLLVIAGLLIGEGRDFDVHAITSKAALSWLYLVLAGSILAFSAYSWLLSVSNPTLVSTYAMVNPIVAVIIGGLVLDEELTRKVALGAVLIVAAVGLLVWHQQKVASKAKTA